MKIQKPRLISGTLLRTYIQDTRLNLKTSQQYGPEADLILAPCPITGTGQYQCIDLLFDVNYAAFTAHIHY